VAKEYTTEQKSMDYKALFASEVGARVLADLDKQGFYKGNISQIFIVDSARQTDFNLGKNAFSRYIHGWIDKKMDEPKQETVKNDGVKL
jgi:hypothetical protein